MQKRGWLALLFLISVMISLFVIPTYAANDVATLKLTDIQAMPGEQFTTTLYVVDGSEIADFDVELLYDTDVVQLVSAKANKNVDGGVTVNTATPGVINLNYSNVENTYEEMPILDMTFQVDDNAGPNSYAFLVRNPQDTNVATRLDGDDYLDVQIVCDFAPLSIFTAGDIDLSGKVEIRDVTHLRRYLARLESLTDYQLLMADAYYDNDVNVRDAVYIQQYLAKYDVRPGSRANVIFYDSSGNLYATKSVLYGSALTKIPAVPARTGYSNGAWSLSATEYIEPDFSAISKEMKVYAFYSDVPIIGEDEYEIHYNLYDNDTYLQKVGVTNPNPEKYSTTDGLTLKNLTVLGYQFLGWFDGQGSNAEQVKTIDKGTTGDIQLFAHWKPVTYTINYECEMGNIPAGTYTVSQSTTLTVPTSDIVPAMSNYIFMGWTNEDGQLVKTIPAGTVGNQTFTSNWTSRRNMARTIGTLEEPLIIEDYANGRILFTYELGTIENVPLYQIGDTFDALAGIELKKSVTKTESIGREEANAIAKTISKATTNSSCWTLAEDWNSVTNVTESYAHEQGLTVEQANTIAKTSSNTFSLSAEQGGSKVTTDSSNISSKLSGSMSHEHTSGTTKEKYQEFNVNGHIGYTPPKDSGGVEGGVDIGYKNGRKTTTTDQTTNGWSISSEIEHGNSHSQTNSANWNVGTSFSASSSVSATESVSKAMSDIISSEKSYGQSYAKGGSKSESRDFSESNASSDEYENKVAFHTDTITSEETEVATNGSMQGSYRFECVGTMHVFGIVGYDIATQSYFVYTYNVMDDNTHVFLDYSYDGTFTEYENGVLPFEIPMDVYDYVGERTLRTEGLVIDNQTGMVTDYQGEDTVVFVPSYVSVPTLSGDTYRSVRVTGIEPDAFSGNTEVTGVILSDFITEIPDGAFDGCTSLQAVYCPSVKSIGDNAFRGCSSLVKFSLPAAVTHIGDNAFESANEVAVVASSKEVAEKTVACGAQNITLNIAGIADTVDGTTFNVPDTVNSFVLQGEGKSYRGIKVKSDAASTTINGVVFTECSGIPLQTSSETLKLQAVTIDSPSYGMLLTADTTEVSLYDNTYVTSSSDKAIVCRNMNITTSPEAVSNGVASKLKVSGNILCCGEVTGTKNLTITEGAIIPIDEATFAKYAKGAFTVTFNANGGEVSEASRELLCDEAIGALPEPTRTGYSFAGWFTAAEGGEQISADKVFDDVNDITLFAHWNAIAFTANWNTGTGYTITVNRTASVYAHAPIGLLENGSTVYYGDDLTVTYAATTGYTLGSTGHKNLVVYGNVTSNDIYATATANSYTYTMKFVSNHGTSLGSVPVTKPYGTTYTYTPPAKSGYNTPGAQTIVWDSTTAKTVTFTYTPTGVSTSQNGPSGNWYVWDGKYGITYATKLQYQNRTANSVQIKVVWTNTMLKNSYYGYAQYFTANIGGKSSGEKQIAASSLWTSYVSYDRTATADTGWITVTGLSATQQSVAINASFRDINGKSGSWSRNISIPTY